MTSHFSKMGLDLLGFDHFRRAPVRDTPNLETGEAESPAGSVLAYFGGKPKQVRRVCGRQAPFPSRSPRERDDETAGFT